MRIGELSRRDSGYREYREEDAATVRGSRLMLAAGLNTATIRGLLPCMADDGGAPAPACDGMLPDLHRERERLSAAAADVLAARDRLDALIRATSRLDPATRRRATRWSRSASVPAPPRSGPERGAHPVAGVRENHFCAEWWAAQMLTSST
ncbi:hypothetical protein GCM10009678_87810 [Actinomadura kijaniata]|uniref:DNA-binding transcriptional MerR regulator n=1 Tax=Actinomadura namibiensis TaxID=182080 RepID=A0A7W3LKP4_ACTNM|nr:MerR family transcriptional regulator [Actinomadura namibiensis]MBA8949847.1 DNA-binding transcriptional MerR regulator [Actinomadura namibiensis]